MPESELQPKLKAICSKYGEVFSLLVKEHKEKGKPFAFICYVDKEAAERAYTEL